MKITACQAPTPRYLKKNYKLPFPAKQSVDLFRQTISDISPLDNRLLIILGPCSIHHEQSFLEYVKKVSSLQKEISPNILLVCRAYIEKPRSGFSWKGYLHQPDLTLPPCYEKGLHASRKLLVESAKLNIPLAMEILDPFFYYFFDDLISWGCIGARTSASQTHRQLAAICPFPVGFKNSVEGNIDAAINGMLASSKPQHIAGINQKGQLCFFQTSGNQSPFLVLRGNNISSNYDSAIIINAYETLRKKNLPPKIIVDCSHDNSKKNIDKQKQIFEELIEKRVLEDLPIIGVMLESFLKRGSQEISSTVDPYQSITDPCLGWEETRSLMLWASDLLNKKESLVAT